MKNILFISFLALELFCNNIKAQIQIDYHEKFQDSRMGWTVLEDKDGGYVTIDTLEQIYDVQSYNKYGVKVNAPLVLNAQKDFSYCYRMSGVANYWCAIGLSNKFFSLDFEVDFYNEEGYRINYSQKDKPKKNKWKKLKGIPMTDSLDRAMLKIESKNNTIYFFLNEVLITEISKEILAGEKEFTKLDVIAVNSDIYITDIFIQGEAKLDANQMYMAGEGMPNEELVKKKRYTIDEAIEDPFNVYRLVIDYRWKYDYLPNEIVNCRNLQEVEISAQNDIDYSEIIKQLQDFPSLQSLEIYSMENIPPAIGELNNLRSLKIFHCKESKVSEEISKLSKLTRLNLFRNDFQEFPENLSKLQNLKYLNLADNDIKTVPEFVFKLPKLDTLDLSYNDLRNIPEDIGKLNSLAYLNICFNELESLPKNIGELVNLKHLELGWNYALTKLPREIGKMKSLEEIDMSGCDNDPCNGLDEIPIEMGNLTNLRSLDFGWCHVKKVPDELKDLKKLEYFRINGDLSDQEKEKVKKTLSFVKEVYL